MKKHYGTQSFKITVVDGGSEFSYYEDAVDEYEAQDIAEEDYPNADSIYVHVENQE